MKDTGMGNGIFSLCHPYSDCRKDFYYLIFMLMKNENVLYFSQFSMSTNVHALKDMAREIKHHC